MKIAITRNKEATAAEIAAMPEHQQDAMARTLIGCISRLFEDPAVKADYERWKRDRSQGAARAKH